MRKIIFCCLFQLISFNYSYAGLLGPSNYEDCVLENIKNAKTDLGVKTVYAICKEKFKKEGAKNIVSECYLTWNGNTFTAGIPENIEKYTKITFQGSSDLLFIPTSLMGSVTQEFIFKEKKKIQSICPSIILK